METCYRNGGGSEGEVCFAVQRSGRSGEGRRANAARGGGIKGTHGGGMDCADGGEGLRCTPQCRQAIEAEEVKSRVASSDDGRRGLESDTPVPTSNFSDLIRALGSSPCCCSPRYHDTERPEEEEEEPWWNGRSDGLNAWRKKTPNP